MPLLRVLLTLGYAGAIFALSDSPRPLGLTSWPLPGLDKLAHACAYALLFALLRWSLAGLRWGASGRARDGLALLLALLYAASDEYHQSFVPGREADLLDLAADGVGAAMAAGLTRWRGIWKDRATRSEDHHAAEL